MLSSSGFHIEFEKTRIKTKTAEQKISYLIVKTTIIGIGIALCMYVKSVQNSLVDFDYFLL